jgi:hypothetical protein
MHGRQGFASVAGRSIQSLHAREMLKQVYDSAETTLGAHRWWLLAATFVGACISAATLVFVPSGLGFALVGPLVGAPWFLFCMGMALRPGPSSKALKPLTIPIFGIMFLVTLAWPIIVLL